MTAISRRLAAVLLTVMCLTSLPVPMGAAQATQQPPRDAYKPISELPPTEQIPASRLLIGAYSFVLVALFLYVVSVGNRLSSVQREVERLEADLKRTRA